ncbi:MAG TPA: phosphatase PAP2 family protein [Alphaproteobacteria bacterium]|nr:phosphatase PAP2 family protein [Alphaproteobacteria bacterium]
MIPPVTLLLILGAAILAIALLRWLALRAFDLLHLGWRTAPRLAGRLGLQRARPLWHRVAERYPRPSAWIAARLHGGRFTGLPLTLMVVAAAYILSLLGGLVDALHEAEGIARIDQAVNDWFAPWRLTPLVEGFVWLTTLGTGAALAGVAVTATGFLWADRRPGFILPLWVTLIGALSTTWAGKFAIGRPRPEFIEAVTAASPSFPSAHSTGAMAVLGFCAYAMARDLPPGRGRFEVGFWAAVLIALIGFSRIFLSVHFLSDVLSGFLVGGFWLLVGFALVEWRRAAGRPPEL